MTSRYRSAIRKRLTALHALRAKSDAADTQIAEAAQGMLERTEADITKLRPRVHLDQDAADRYQSLVRDRGLLERLVR